MKKIVIALVIIIVLMVVFMGLHHWFNGYTTLSTFYLEDYTVSEDGSEITMKIGNFSSMGFARDIKAVQKGEGLYVKVYMPYGPPGSNWNAKDTFTLKVEGDCSEIYFWRGKGEYEMVLKRNDMRKTFPKGTPDEVVKRENAPWIRPLYK